MGEETTGCVWPPPPRDLELCWKDVEGGHVVGPQGDLTRSQQSVSLCTLQDQQYENFLTGFCNSGGYQAPQ